MHDIDNKIIYRGKELPFFDYFESKKEGLRNEFLAEYPDFSSTQILENSDILQNDITAKISTTRGRGTAWKQLIVKGSYFGKPPYYGSYSIEESTAKFPTTVSIIDFFGFDNLGAVTYSVLEANGIIARHTGPENRAGKFIRCHIPLIVPEGDLGMEINGEVIDWAESFGFNNQIIHSVWNNTDYRRLVLMIDIRRSYIGLPDAAPWTEETNANAVPFEKTHNKVIFGPQKIVPAVNLK